VEFGESEDVEAEHPTARAVVEVGELLSDLAPVLLWLAVVDPTELECDQPVERRNVVEEEPGSSHEASSDSPARIMPSSNPPA
jgi:hypothetical protein